ncbi:ATP/GTP-binding protein [Cellulosimicrobium composti]|uniref:ATP-binding protein n=1 Tax=Cellulosimicrobium composti TaxID=2672572 RepID=A0ABX0B8P6_9MICO|nr:ATP-binding protein [Cellulosimicrobium composti]NDO88621.1 ATP-binding protein [Cellulosimicrobium composti]
MSRGSRVAVVGAYGAGKTTLVRALSARLGLPVAATTAMRDPVPGVPRALEDCSPEEVFQLVLRRFDERVRGETALGDGLLSDGSVLHEWVYLAGVAAARREGADLGPLARRATCELARGLGRRYDLVVHVAPEVPLPPDAPIDATFQAALDRRTRAALRLSGVRAVTVTGDVEERVAGVVGRLT